MTPSTADSDLTAADALRVALHQLFRRMRRENPGPGALSLQLLLTLATIARHPGIGVAELARLENLRGPTVSSHLRQLVSAGLVRRTATDPNDRRRVQLSVTAAGQEAVTDMQKQRTRWLAERLATLPPDGRAAIAAAIEPLRQLAR